MRISSADEEISHFLRGQNINVFAQELITGFYQQVNESARHNLKR
jgi:hypothetical protein